ncbi:synapse-associated protein of 47 kDa isoform X2 [Chrysoperla carnea]|uniref:synapse-associated protein of 47 kDa isoform X2 n=1 Tax=Chrysoperla carnea TaxID=189513 RepID=UPI001D071385|nr:synapse-associated protein of 47 kDa isoform X2 [Chrysoperla carnea]
MFSGLTNQVTSLWGSAKGDQEEQVPTPTETDPAKEINVTASPTNPDDSSPTKGSKLEMLANVKSQMTGWLGSGVSVIPGLRGRQGGDGAEDTTGISGGIDNPAQDPTNESPIPGSPSKQKTDDDDNSSVTEGADSGPGSGTGTPTEDKDANFDAGKVSTKALAGVKSMGSFLYSAVNKAGAKVSEASAKIKKTVEENSILGEFNKEQEAFIKEQQAKTATSSVPPWVGCPNEEALKEECLSLSSNRRNFIRAPPAGVEFNFDYEVSYPIAVAIMAEDPNLEKMRFDLVPKVINEEQFWRNYFYRVSLICQANEQSFSSADSVENSAVNEEEWMKEIDAELSEFEVLSTDKVDDENFEQDLEKLEKEILGYQLDSSSAEPSEKSSK